MTNTKRKQELKEKIYFKALELFKENGYEKVTVQEITDACNIAKGTFFNYFAKKDEILLYLGISQIEHFHIFLNEYASLPLKEQIENSLGKLLQRFLNHGEIMKLAVLELIKSNYLIHSESKSIMQVQSILVKKIQYAMDCGTFQSKWTPELIASTIIGVYFNTLMMLIIQQNVDAKLLFNQNLQVIWEGISAK